MHFCRPNSYLYSFLPFTDLCILNVPDVGHQNTPHVDILRLFVVILAVGAVTLSLPLRVTLLGTTSLYHHASTIPQAAQIA